MRRLVVLSAAIAVAACSPSMPEDRPDTQGGAARAEMEGAVTAFAGCISEQAETMPVEAEAAGTLAINAVKMCQGQREELVEKVAALNAIGFPNRTPRQLQAVAEASVKILEDEARQAAAVTIVQRQNAGDAAAAATETGN